jgi:putative drug exporter of the RND superfamily
MTRENNLAARLGGWSARHRLAAVSGWLLLVVVTMLIGSLAGQVPGGDQPRAACGQLG